MGMGYGLGAFLLAVGLILALAVNDAVEAVDLQLVGWIVAGAGALILVLAIATNFRRSGGAGATSTTTHRDGSQTTTRQEPPQY